MNSKTPKILLLLTTLIGTALTVCILLKFYACPIKLIFKIPCPGCGFSRAMLNVFTLDFAEAFRLFPVWPLVICDFVYFLTRIFVKPPKWTDDTVLWASCGILLLQYVIRLCLGILP